MWGAIIGDIAGSEYEFMPTKAKDFKIITKISSFTDDTVMTVAIADALLSLGENVSNEDMKAVFVSSMQKWGREYSYAGYGGMFASWLRCDDPQPYNSYGNGSAMRVSSVGWLYDSIEQTRKTARLSAEVTHNHPEGIKGAEATAATIFLARTGYTKEEIRDYIEQEFGYNLHRTCAQIRPAYIFKVSCQESVPEAIIAFMDSFNYEFALREAISLGGDADTQAAIAGGIAEAFYGIPDSFKERATQYLPEDMLEVIRRFEKQRKNRT